MANAHNAGFFPSAPESEGLGAALHREAGNLENLRQKVKAVLELNTAHERDRVRLSRTLQLVDHYAPKAADTPEKPGLLQLLRNRAADLVTRRSRKKLEEIRAARLENPYLLAEDSVASLRRARRIREEMKRQNPDATATEILDQGFGGEPVGRENAATSLTLDYERKNWGIERIGLDGIQNHLPSDSGGTRVWVQCLVDNRWVTVDQARERKNDIKAVRFADDGAGFDPKNLSILWSTKADEENSRGQFGEGMKMIAASAVREGLGMMLESQNWQAVPKAKPITVENTRKGHAQSVEQLTFDIAYFGERQKMRGSRTTFWTPTPAFIDEVLRLDKKVMDLRPGYRPPFVSQHGLILGTAPGLLFTKGILISQGNNTLFSYDFPQAKINRDRNQFVGFSLEREIGKILSELDDKRLIKTLLQRSVIEPERPYEKPSIENEGYYSVRSKYPGLWKTAFEECFGKDACLDTGFAIPPIIDASKIRRIKFHRSVLDRLTAAGVETDADAVPDFHSETLPTSLTLEYGAAWNAQTMFLNAAQNHLPEDSGGRRIDLRFKTRDGAWHEYEELARFPDTAIDTIHLSDDGRGYDYRMLSILGSTKDGTDGSGKFGEGLKMLALTSIDMGSPVTFRSRGWVAVPRIQEEIIDGKTFGRLVFDVTKELKPGALARANPDGLRNGENSATIFKEPPGDLLAEFRNAHETVLAVQNPKPLVQTEAGNILGVTGGKLYVRQILIPGNHDLRYSYHLPQFDIQSRDRNAIAANDLRRAVGEVWERVPDTTFIQDYLMQATQMATTERASLEFDTILYPREQHLWVEAFRNLFGMATAFKDVASDDFNAVHENMHMGLQTVIMPTAVCSTLARCHDKDGLGIMSLEDARREANNIEIIPDEKLTGDELKTLHFLRQYAYPLIVPDAGQRVPIVACEARGKITALGLSGNPLKLNRCVLSDVERATDVFIHEDTHNQTGAHDADPGFRNRLSALAAQLALASPEIKDHVPTLSAPSMLPKLKR